MMRAVLNYEERPISMTRRCIYKNKCPGKKTGIGDFNIPLIICPSSAASEEREVLCWLLAMLS